VLQNIPHNAERRLKRTHSHSERKTEPAVGTQQEQHDKQHMPLPPNLLETTETVDDVLHRQYQAEAEVPAEETRSLLQTI
jgi:hypothetical protein